jgi:hypothetical protein
MIQLAVTSDDSTDTAVMADDLVPDLSRIEGLRVRRKQEPTAGIASEPITTAILLAVASGVTKAAVGELWNILRQRVLSTGKGATIAVEGRQAAKSFGPVKIQISVSLAASSVPPAELERAVIGQGGG